MTDEGSVPVAPPAEPTPAPEAPAVEIVAAPVPEPVVETPAVEAPTPVPPEAIKEVSEEIVEAVQEALAPEKPETHEVTPQKQNSEASPPESTKLPAPSPVPQFEIKSLRPAALAKRHEDIRERLDRISELRRLDRAIKNQDVEEFLGIADATASRYLRLLVLEGTLQKVGNGKGTRYKFT